MTRRKPTIADLRAAKGRGQFTMLRIMTLDEAAAAEEAGIDIVSLPPELVTHPRYREVAPSLFSMTGKTHLQVGAVLRGFAASVHRDVAGGNPRLAVKVRVVGNLALGDAVGDNVIVNTVEAINQDGLPLASPAGDTASDKSDGGTAEDARGDLIFVREQTDDVALNGGHHAHPCS